MVIRLKILKNNKISINNFHLHAPLFETICFLDLPIIVGKLMVLNAVLASSSGYLIGSLAVHWLTERSVFPKLNIFGQLPPHINGVFGGSCLLPAKLLRRSFAKNRWEPFLQITKPWRWFSTSAILTRLEREHE